MREWEKERRLRERESTIGRVRGEREPERERVKGERERGSVMERTWEGRKEREVRG